MAVDISSAARGAPEHLARNKHAGHDSAEQAEKERSEHDYSSYCRAVCFYMPLYTEFRRLPMYVTARTTHEAYGARSENTWRRHGDNAEPLALALANWRNCP
jgi:hypothetical protein